MPNANHPPTAQWSDDGDAVCHLGLGYYGPHMDTFEPFVNEHGVERTRQRIFRWEDQDTYVRSGDSAQFISGEHMHIGRAVFPPGSEYEMHSHPHEQFSLLLSGRMLLTVGDETSEIGPGDGWYVPGDVEHGGLILGDEPVVFIAVYSPATRWIFDVLDEPGVRRIPAGANNPEDDE